MPLDVSSPAASPATAGPVLAAGAGFASVVFAGDSGLAVGGAPVVFGVCSVVIFGVGSVVVFGRGSDVTFGRGSVVVPGVGLVGVLGRGSVVVLGRDSGFRGHVSHVVVEEEEDGAANTGAVATNSNDRKQTISRVAKSCFICKKNRLAGIVIPFVN